MNQKTAYEQIITGKLQAAPVPDMADAIWARIEAQLDLDLPQNDPPPTNGPSTPSGGIILGGFSLVFVIALITFLLLKKEPTQNPTTLQPANNTTIQQNELETFVPPNEETSLKSIPVTLPPASTVLLPSISDSNTISATPSAVIAGNDSTTGALPVAISTPVSTSQKQDSLLPIKKGRGVAGIKDEDYKIVPKKDSINNN